MNIIGDKIKEELKRQGITIADLVKKAKLPQASVDNIIYGRSKKKEIIAKIAKIFGLPIEYFLDIEAKSNKFNAKLYHLAFNIVYRILVERNVEITKNLIDEHVYDTYLFALNNKNIEEKEMISYIQGMIFAEIKQGKVALKNS
jgi:transcriptional regulator with XRE-family HTH domain